MRRENKGRVNIVAIIIIAVFVFLSLLCFGIFSTIMFSAFREKRQEMKVNPDEYDTTVNATVIDYSQSEMYMGEGSNQYTSDVFNPIYQYEYNGETYTSNSNISTSEKPYEIGEVVSVRISSLEPEKMYDPNYNAESEFKSFLMEGGIMVLFPAFIGLIIFIAVIAVVIFAIRKKMEGPQVIPTSSFNYSNDNDQDNW